MDNNRLKGFIYGAIAAASYGLNPLFALPMYKAGMGVDSVLFYRYLSAVVLLGGLMVVRRQSFSLRRAEVVPLAAMGLLFAFSSLFLFQSYNLMDAGIASTILFVYPVLVAVIMALFFHERISVITALSIVVAFSGISLLCKGEGGVLLSLTGIGLVFLSSLCYALYIVGVNRSALRQMSTEKLTFYALLFGLLVYFVRLNFGFGLQAVPESELWLNAVCLGFFPTVVSLVTMARAIHYIGSTPTAILGALEPVTALFFGVLVFGESFTLRIGTGVVLVLLAVSLIIAGKPLASRLTPFFRQHKAH